MKKFLLNWLLNDFIKKNPIPRQFIGVVVSPGDDDNSHNSIKRALEYKNCSIATWNWFRELLKYAEIDNKL